MLLLIATPIGNLQDISLRAKEALASCDLLVCEDTRHTGLLYQAYSIPKVPFMSLHKFNESAHEDSIIEKLKQNQTVGLVSDAGTPGICDPGAALVRRCHTEGIPVSIIPGPCAAICGYAASGAIAAKFSFCGFFPKTTSDLLRMLHEARLFDGDTIGYESPKRLIETLLCIEKISPSWEITLARELTKMHEEIVRKTSKEMVLLFKDREPKGECVIILHQEPHVSTATEEQIVQQVVVVRDRFKCSLREAVELVAARERLPQRSVYQMCIS